jgi:hypothetical protein
MKTLEEMAEEYAGSIRIFDYNTIEIGDRALLRKGFLAGYKAAENHFRDVTEKVGPQWISVKDRLPEDGEEVLVFEEGTISTNCFSHYRVAPHRWDLYPSGFSCNPSYWMELPAPPKEKK